MNFQKLTLLIFLFSISQFLFAQEPIPEPECILFHPDIPEDEDQYVERDWFFDPSILDSVINATNSGLAPRSLSNCGFEDDYFSIPVELWVYLRESETNDDGVTLFNIQATLDQANAIFAQNNIPINVSTPECINYIVDESGVIQSPWINYWRTINGSEDRPGRIDIHVVEDILGSNNGVYMGAHNDIMLTRAVFTTPNARTTFIHELGHALGLAHPHRRSHRGRCLQEPVSRTRQFEFRCRKNGTMAHRTADGFSDTPADPELDDTNVNSACEFIGDQTDNWQQRYSDNPPDTRNVMSYSRRSCRDNFTNGQIAAMRYEAPRIENGGYQQLNLSPNSRPDAFEPDNHSLGYQPRIISIGETQIHSFHDDARIHTSALPRCEDIEDWLLIRTDGGHIGTYELTFDSPCGEFLNNPVPGITSIEVWTTALNPLTGLLNRANQLSTVSVSSYPVTIEIPCNETSTSIMIGVIGGATGVPVDRIYSVSLENEEGDIDLVGTTYPCGDNNFEVQANGQSLPSDYSVSWTLFNGGGGILDPSLDGNNATATLTGVGLGSMPLIVANIVAPNGCSKSQFLSLPEFTGVSSGEISQIYVAPTWDGCEGEFTAHINAPEGSTFQWNCENVSGHSYFYSNCSESSSSSINGGTYFYNADQHTLDALFSVTVTDPCGNVTVRTIEYTFNAYDCEGGEGFSDNGGVVIYPNPATDEISVLIDNEVSDFLYSEYTEYTIYNQFGVEVLQDQKPSDESSLNIQSLNEGLYLIQVKSSTHEIQGTFYKDN